ncbi:GAF domain-containing protein (plasmid) [Deinococcus taeanensis]|uniref:GAF domain-containing protein n=1 Tax=Deinococcus taeanensis TaxID=2737050 RepID=UPI001CDB7089|nr:GAF domain-containing protein [Deinococcus taeanensis]UBV44286.1 GAF domain-containing protein [Deinococcus taeanensis]
MTSAPVPSDEAARLLDLARYQVLDTAREEPFDRVTRLAARLLSTPVAVINLIDQYRQWSKAMVGLSAAEAPRQESFCAWTIGGDVPFVIENAPADPRFRNNPMVTGDPHIHMYAGAPLVTPAGHRIGTLCVTDSRPHTLSPEDLACLQDLAAIAMQELELRRERLEAARCADAQRRLAEEYRRTLDQARVVEGVTSLMTLGLPVDDALENAAGLIREAAAADVMAVLTWAGGDLRAQVLGAARAAPADLDGLRAALLFGTAAPLEALRDRQEPLYIEDYASRPDVIVRLARAGVTQVAAVPLGTAGGAQRLLLALRAAVNDVDRWRLQDRALLEVTGRTLAHALRQQP